MLTEKCLSVRTRHCTKSLDLIVEVLVLLSSQVKICSSGANLSEPRILILLLIIIINIFV